MKCWIAAIVAVLVFLASESGSAAVVTKPIAGTISATGGSPADVGAGTVSGSVTFDDETGLPFFGTEVFDLIALELAFSNGPTITEVDDPFGQIELDDTSGELVSMSVLVVGLDGFGLNGLDFSFDPFATSFLFSDGPNAVVEGSIDFQTSAVPLPAAVWSFGAALVAVGIVARRRKALASAI